MIDKLDFKSAHQFGKSPGRHMVRAAWRGIPARMIMCEKQTTGAMGENVAHDLAGRKRQRVMAAGMRGNAEQGAIFIEMGQPKPLAPRDPEAASQDRHRIGGIS